jgi:hypothetical protein
VPCNTRLHLECLINFPMAITISELPFRASRSQHLGEWREASQVIKNDSKCLFPSLFSLMRGRAPFSSPLCGFLCHSNSPLIHLSYTSAVMKFPFPTYLSALAFAFPVLGAVQPIPVPPAVQIESTFTGNATYKQHISHADHSLGDFSQRYWWSTEFWKGPGSPVCSDSYVEDMSKWRG